MVKEGLCVRRDLVGVVSESRIVADFTDCADFKRFCVRGAVGCGRDAISFDILSTLKCGDS